MTTPHTLPDGPDRTAARPVVVVGDANVDLVLRGGDLAIFVAAGVMRLRLVHLRSKDGR